MRFFLLCVTISCLVEAYQWNPTVNKLPGSSLFMKVQDKQPQIEKGLTGIEKMMKTVSLGFRLIGGSALIGATASTIPPAFADAVPVVGQQAPDFTLPSSVGKEISLNDLKGKRTVLYFYPVSYYYCTFFLLSVTYPARLILLQDALLKHKPLNVILPNTKLLMLRSLEYQWIRLINMLDSVRNVD